MTRLQKKNARGSRDNSPLPADPGPGPESPEEGASCIFSRRYALFIKALENNDNALEIMSDFQGKLRGESAFDLEYVYQKVEELMASVEAMVKYLDQMGRGSYKELLQVQEAIADKVRQILARRRTIPQGRWVAPFADLSAEDDTMVGGKAAHLGEMLNKLGLPVPKGFAISTYAFQEFMRINELWSMIERIMLSADLGETADLYWASEEIKEFVLRSPLPTELDKALRRAYGDLLEGCEKPCGVALRSSALLEDGHLGMAGQYDTSLNVMGPDLERQYKRIIASQFNAAILQQAHGRGQKLNELAMGVAVMRMVKAKVSGVLYTTNPNDPDAGVMMVAAVRGLGAWAVGGQVRSSLYLVRKDAELTVVKEELSPQASMIVCDPKGGISQEPLPDPELEQAYCTHEQIQGLCAHGLRLEQHYGKPVDVEWAVGPEGDIQLLQVRPLRIVAKQLSPGQKEHLVEGARVLVQGGVTVSAGVAAGKVMIVSGEADLERLEPGSVLVAPSSLPEYAMFLDKVAAVITEVGGRASHLAAVSRERGVPAVFNLKNACRILQEGQEVTLDAESCTVYGGVVEPLVARYRKRLVALSETSAVELLDSCLKYLAPLNLTDPRREDFRPQGCQTLHDVTRYAHEMAIGEMFRYAEERGDASEQKEGGGEALRLSAGLPLELFLIDLGGGIKDRSQQGEVLPQDIESVPLNALLRGMISTQWRGPGPTAPHHVAAALEEGQDPSKIMRQNYAIVSKDYLNFSSRLGFHFSTLDTFCSKHDNDNYIRFLFKGGGADPDRRNRRARYIGNILQKLGFRVEVKEDHLLGSLDKGPSGLFEDKLGLLGKLMVTTRQMDMLMFSDAVVDWYVDEFMKTHT